ncbi:MAG: SUMF1/EgtB/PvdO family nonheme iron enzyme [Cyanobacteria bacterium P01_C01_bin.72]
MKSLSAQSCRDSTVEIYQQARCDTLDLLDQIDKSVFFQQVHPEFSPIGWHFGHIAFTEAYWILEHLADSPLAVPAAYQRLFAADGLPKQERQNLPSIATIKQYLQTVRSRTLDYLATAPIIQQERLWRWLIQHEGQHCETITFLWQLYQQHSLDIVDFSNSQLITSSKAIAFASDVASDISEMVQVEAGEFIIGSDGVNALDNERPAHRLHVDTFEIDRYPVTCRQYRQFINSGGYQQSQYWSEAGWQWLQQHPVNQPLYWSNNPDWLDHPVVGISYYEAEAYANFVQKRLPTEAEWEKAAQGASFNCNYGRLIGHTTPVDTYEEASIYGCQDMLGNVWEWTSSWFDGYPGFSSYPYSGYSEVYFDGEHRVLRGGSWATSKEGLRTSFRNWYHPQVRQIFAGLRCAKS